MRRIYLDYAATTPLDRGVFEEMLPFLTEDFGNPDSLHSFGRKAAYAVTCARDTVAEVCGVLPEEVYFTSGGTEADNWAVALISDKNPAASAIEHAAVLSAMDNGGAGLRLPVSADGAVDLNAFDGDALAMMAVNNETGCIQPVKEAAALCRARGAIFFSDCVQAAVSQNLKEICALADIVSLSSHKVYGPKGVGALVIKKGVTVKPLVSGGEQERGMRGGTLNVAAVVGFAAALKKAQSAREEFCAHTGGLRDAFEEYVACALGARVRVDGKNRAPNISHLTFYGEGNGTLLSRLDLNGIAAAGGAACSAHSPLPSHVMLAMGRSEEEARSGIRFSFGKDTKKEEVLAAARTVVALARGEEI